MARHKLIIGRSELVDFPDLDLNIIPAKTDSGAYRSAIHASNITEVTEGKAKKLTFTLLGGHNGSPVSGDTEAQRYRKVIVENSFGVGEERYAVVLRIKIGPRICRTEFTLADRSKKTYPILLGRKLTNNRFLIDTHLANADRTKLKKLKVYLEKDLEETDI